jgi:ligand-binding sensor domain-containing protein
MRYIKMILNTTFLFSVLTTFNSCKGQVQKPTEIKTEQSISVNIGDTVSKLGKNIDCIFQDKNDSYWFASNGEGVYRFDGKTITHFTDKDGLCSNFVWKVEEDINGKLWFATRDGFCSFDGKEFINYTETIKNAPYGKLNYTSGGLFFGHLNGICYYDGKAFTNFAIHPSTYIPPTNTNYRPYEVYCTLVDQSGKIWFGTQEKGVSVYDGKTFTFIDSKDLGGPAVRSIFQDRNGILWFGNNGGGFYRYDGKTLRNITEEKNLTNYEFLKEKKLVDKQGSLARVFAINQDNEGNIWIGTVDAGVWKYDGANLTNLTIKDGLSGNAVYVIFKDKKGKLWFVSNGENVFHFDGQKFSELTF